MAYVVFGLFIIVSAGACILGIRAIIRVIRSVLGARSRSAQEWYDALSSLGLELPQSPPIPLSISEGAASEPGIVNVYSGTSALPLLQELSRITPSISPRLGRLEPLSADAEGVGHDGLPSEAQLEAFAHELCRVADTPDALREVTLVPEDDTSTRVCLHFTAVNDSCSPPAQRHSQAFRLGKDLSRKLALHLTTALDEILEDDVITEDLGVVVRVPARHYEEFVRLTAPAEWQ
ncbi:MAG: hypothetical protein Q4G30_07370 [Actinomycetaceae bacterium]|nr:hypothetical protein [Actinomycetaceae bacterium]